MLLIEAFENIEYAHLSHLILLGVSQQGDHKFLEIPGIFPLTLTLSWIF